MITVDIAADLNDEDETGFVWTYLDEARDPALIRPGNVVIAGAADAPAVCEVIDLVAEPSGMIVHLRLLLLAGEYDVGLPPRNATEYAGLFEHAELAVQPGAGHFPWRRSRVVLAYTAGHNAEPRFLAPTRFILGSTFAFSLLPQLDSNQQPCD